MFHAVLECLIVSLAVAVMAGLAFNRVADWAGLP